MYKITRVGDQCTHGAKVITGDGSRIVEDQKVARVGDLVFCPLPRHGVNKIISSVANIVMTADQKTSHTVSRTQCGAVIITGSQSVVIDRHPDKDDSGGT